LAPCGYRDTTERQVYNSESIDGQLHRQIQRGIPARDADGVGSAAGAHRARAPGAIETISYAIPTFDLNGKHLVHFAGYARHVGFYPIPSGLEAFKEDLAPYKRGKGSVQFPLGQPLPTDLIRRIVEFRVAENLARASKKSRQPAE
jgi:uncharacterized protein YdhG (YjbR/CyaY superfamily)